MSKIHFNARLNKNTVDLINAHYVLGNYDSKSQFIDEAVEFYCAYLGSKNLDKFLMPYIDETIERHISSAGDHIAKTFFREAVELDMMMHIIAATNNVDIATLKKLRGACVDEVKQNRGKVFFDEAAKLQKG